MERTITVKGTGAVKVAPDCVVLSMDLKTQDMDYGKAMDLAAKRIDHLKSAVVNAGFADDDLKTTSFNVETDYVSRKNWQDEYERVFNGYAVSQSLKLSFDFDTKVLAKALTVVASCEAHPELSIHFTVKHPEEVSEALLRDASENAFKKAQLLCSASHVKLGQLVKIDYNWGELDIYSRTGYDVDSECMPMMACSQAVPDITPDNIDVHDTVTFIWEIQ